MTGVGLFGTGFMGRAHARAWQTARALLDGDDRPRLEAVVGRPSQRRDRLAAAYDVPRITDDWRSVIDDTSVDLVDICNENHRHAEIAIASALAGKSFICEKPLAATPAEAADVVRATMRSGVVGLCAFNYRFFPAVRRMHDMIATGDIGTPARFRGRFVLGRRREDQAGHDWRGDPATGGGVVGDLLSHHIDLARHLVGEVSHVTALTRTPAADTYAAEDTALVILEFDNGAIGSLEATRRSAAHVVTSEIEIDGDEGALEFRVDRLNELRVGRHGVMSHVDVTSPGDPYLEHWWGHGHALGWGDSFVHEVLDFVDASAGRPHIGASVLDGYRTAVIVAAIHRSAASGARAEVSFEVME